MFGYSELDSKEDAVRTRVLVAWGQNEDNQRGMESCAVPKSNRCSAKRNSLPIRLRSTRLAFRDPFPLLSTPSSRRSARANPIENA